MNIMKVFKSKCTYEPQILKTKKLAELTKEEMLEILERLGEMERGAASAFVTECLKRLMKGA
jgi:viroplasmin and RNaseH domain-containing protein